MTHPTFREAGVLTNPASPELLAAIATPTITPATPEQATAMRAIFARRMASALIAGDGIDLGDDAACADRLAACGFGDRLIAALLPDAQAVAIERISA